VHELVRCIASVLNVKKPNDWPTAHVSVGEITATSDGSSITVLAFGLETIVHAEPSQCWVMVRRSKPVSKNPTAQASVLEVPSTEKR
jgi:hypothetical protein